MCTCTVFITVLARAKLGLTEESRRPAEVVPELPAGIHFESVTLTRGDDTWHPIRLVGEQYVPSTRPPQ